MSNMTIDRNSAAVIFLTLLNVETGDLLNDEDYAEVFDSADSLVEVSSTVIAGNIVVETVSITCEGRQAYVTTLHYLAECALPVEALASIDKGTVAHSALFLSEYDALTWHAQFVAALHTLHVKQNAPESMPQRH